MDNPEPRTAPLLGSLDEGASKCLDEGAQYCLRRLLDNLDAQQRQLDPKKLDLFLDRLEQELISRLDAWILRQQAAAQEAATLSLPSLLVQSSATPTPLAAEAAAAAAVTVAEVGAAGSSLPVQVQVDPDTLCSEELSGGADAVTSHQRSDRSFKSRAEYQAAHIVAQRLGTIEDLSAPEHPPGFLESSRASLRKILKAWPCEAAVAFLIALNAVWLGVQAETAARSLGKEQPEAFFYIDLAFTTLFTVELLARLYADGCKFFRESYWNYLDLFVVCNGIFDAVEVFLGNESSVRSSSGLRLLRFVRMTRFLKAMRIGRVMRVLSAMRSLVNSIMATLTSLFWAMCLLFLIMYIFAVLFTDAAVSRLSEQVQDAPWSPTSPEAALDRYFGNLTVAMNTLFRSISGGTSWETVADALQEVDAFYMWMFNFYVAFITFAVINVVTGVFCQAAIDQSMRDQQYRVEAVLKEKSFYLEQLEKLFQKIDSDGSGRVTITEFEQHFDDTAVTNLFAALDLVATDAWELFKLIDINGDNSIEAEEFMESCMTMRGHASAMDVATLRKDIKQTRSIVTDFLESQTTTNTQTSAMLHQGVMPALQALSYQVALNRLQSTPQDVSGEAGKARLGLASAPSLTTRDHQARIDL